MISFFMDDAFLLLFHILDAKFWFPFLSYLLDLMSKFPSIIMLCR